MRLRLYLTRWCCTARCGYFNKVAEPNPSYVAPETETGGLVSNWFEMPDLGDVEIEELEITDDVYSTRSYPWGAFEKSRNRKQYLEKYLGTFRRSSNVWYGRGNDNRNSSFNGRRNVY